MQKLGAGEGIRTLDPNLGKVVLIVRLCSPVFRLCLFFNYLAVAMFAEVRHNLPEAA